MTLFTLDGSGYQPNADHAAIVRQGFSALTAKSTQGATGRDSAFAHNYAGAKAAGLRFAAYHFLTERPAAAQADNCAGMINDRTIPVHIDLERTTGSHPTLAMALSFAGEMDKRGYDVPVIYFPHFYWQELGSPKFPGGFLLWQALYPNNRSGHATDIYKNVPSSYWNSQGGETPTLLQFSDLIHVDSYNLNTWDCSAFDGDIVDLDTLSIFRNWHPVPPVTDFPQFPLGPGQGFGTPSFLNNHGLSKWQQRMSDRGWPITVDDIYGPQTKSIALAFQHEKHLTVDGVIGVATWNAAWKAPVT